MSNVKEVQSMDIVSNIQKEVQSTLDQIAKLDIKSSENVNATGTIIGPAAVLVTKVHVLRDLLEITRGCAVFEGIDRRVTAMSRAGQDLRAAFVEMTNKQDPKAKEWMESIIKAWDDAVIK